MLGTELSQGQWLGDKEGSRSQFKADRARAVALWGQRLYPHEPCFHGILGIIHDVEGNHEKARAEFRKSGALRPDPFWHLLMSTSWGMSGDFRASLAEVQIAINEGARYWLVDFYHGRALGRCGDYDQALPELEKALKDRRWQPQALGEMADVHYLQGRLGKAAKYAAACGFAAFMWSPLYGLRRFGAATHHISLHWVCGLSKRAWPISRYIPALSWLHLKVMPPSEPEATLAEMVFQMGHYSSAEKHARTACAAMPDSPRLLANLSICLSAEGKKSEAIRTCEMAIQSARRGPLLDQLKQIRASVESNE